MFLVAENVIPVVSPFLGRLLLSYLQYRRPYDVFVYVRSTSCIMF